jgi:hypothetical protein
MKMARTVLLLIVLWVALVGTSVIGSASFLEFDEDNPEEDYYKGADPEAGCEDTVSDALSKFRDEVRACLEKSKNVEEAKTCANEPINRAAW